MKPLLSDCENCIQPVCCMDKMCNEHLIEFVTLWRGMNCGCKEE